MVDLNELAAILKTWFPELLKNSFASSADNFSKANNIEMPYAVVLPQSSEVETYPTFKNPAADFKISQLFKIEFYLNVKSLKDKAGFETPFWAHLSIEPKITNILFVNMARLFLNSSEVLHFGSFEYFIGDNALVLSYTFRRKYCFTSAVNLPTNTEEFLISDFKIDTVLVDYE